MTQEEKQILLKDLCARLPYGVRYKGDKGWGINPYQHTGSLSDILNSEEPLVYLRPMSSMTKEEMKTYQALQNTAFSYYYEFGDIVDYFQYLDNEVSLDYLNSIHIDYRGLIEKGLALEMPEEMYK